MSAQILQIRRLSWILLASLSLNAVQGSFLFYWLFRERPPTPICESPLMASLEKPLATKSDMSASIRALKILTIQDLIQKLPDKRVVENGFTVGDLSLAILANFYYFDIERALQRSLEQKVIPYGNKGETLLVYPALKEEDFFQIERFIRQEKWPFRAQGLYRLLKNDKFNRDKTLADAFFSTPEYLSAERLLSRAPVIPEKNEILELILSGQWGHLAALHEKQRTALDLSEGPRRLFLLSWIQNGSLPAASLLLKTDWDFAIKKIDDKTTIQILTLLKGKPELAKKYAEEILKTPRSNIVRKSALTYVPEKVDLKQASLKLLPKTPSTQPVLPPSKSLKPATKPKTS